MSEQQADTAPAPAAPPYRVVDREGRGWWRMSGSGDYWTDNNSRRWTEELDPRPYPVLVEERGPLRPVTAAPAGDHALLVEALVAAEKKAAASLCVAVYEVIRDSERGRPFGEIIAGRAGSWEAAALYDHVGWRIAPDLDAKRVRSQSVAEIAAVLRRWTQSDDHFVEVAASLPDAFQEAAGKLEGWASATDQGLRRDDALFRYLMSGG